MKGIWWLPHLEIDLVATNCRGTVMFDENLCKEMGKRGRKLAEKVHNWEYCEDRIESLYKFVKKTKNQDA